MHKFTVFFLIGTNTITMYVRVSVCALCVCIKIFIYVYDNVLSHYLTASPKQKQGK